MFAQASFLLALVAEELRDGEPLHRLLVIAFVRGGHARERGRHLRAQRDFAVALVLEIIELADDFRAALGGEEFQRFERRAVVFAEAGALGNRAPLVKNILARVGAPHVGVREWFGIKIAETGQSFHAAQDKNYF